MTGSKKQYSAHPLAGRFDATSLLVAGVLLLLAIGALIVAFVAPLLPYGSNAAVQKLIPNVTDLERVILTHLANHTRRRRDSSSDLPSSVPVPPFDAVVSAAGYYQHGHRLGLHDLRDVELPLQPPAGYFLRSDGTLFRAQPLAITGAEIVNGSIAEADLSADYARGAPHGVAPLDAAGRIPAAHIPAWVVTTVTVVDDIIARNALSTSAAPGDIVIVLDADGAGHRETFIWSGAPTNLWQIMTDPSRVTSVNGRTAAVTLTAADVGLSLVDNIKNHYTAASNPGAGDDATQSFSVGSMWINTLSGTVWQCVDNTASAAEWKRLHELYSASVIESYLADGAVSAAKLQAGAVSTAQLALGAVTATRLASNAVTAAAVADGTLISSKYAAGSIGNAALATDAVSTATVQDGALTASKYAALSVDTSALASGAVVSDKLGTASVTLVKLAGDSVDGSKVVDGSLSSADYAAGSVLSTTIAPSAVHTDNIAAAAVTQAKLAAGAVVGGVGGAIVDGSITAADVDGTSVQLRVSGSCSSGSQMTGIDASGGVVCSSAIVVPAGSIGAAELASASVTAAKLAAGSVVGGAGGAIADGTIDAADMVAAYQRAAANGLAPLDASGLIPTAHMPPLSITNVFSAANITERDALTPQMGDVAIVIDIHESFIWDGSAWLSMSTPDAVTSVNGATGAITLDTDNVAEGAANLYYTQARVSANSNVAANSAHRAQTSGNPHGVTKADVGLSQVANIKNNFGAGSPPLVSDDSASGYAIGSRWVVAGGGGTYHAVDVSVGAAIWTRLDLYNGVITTAKLADSAVSEPKLADGAVTAGKIAAGSIGTAHYAVGSVDSAALGAASVVSAKIGAAEVQTSHLADALITAAKIAAGQVDSAALATASVVQSKLAASSVTSSAIVDGTIVAADFDAVLLASLGNVDGPGSGSTHNALVRWDGTTGTLVRDSSVTLSDAGSIALPAMQTVDGRDVSVDGATLDAHVANVNIHRVINDASSASVDLWSAAKISSELSGKSATGHTHNAAAISDFAAAADARITLQKASANGLATLDGAGKVPTSQLSISSLQYQGAWNANTNAPALANASCTQGHYYVVSVNGATTLDGVSAWNAGDWVVCSSTNMWEKADNSDAVTSVNGKQGAVVLVAGDIVSGTFADAQISATSVTQHVSALLHQSLSGAGTNTHADIDSHMADSSLHRTIADGSTSATSLWSSSKIANELAGKSALSHTHAASDIVSGTLADARISQSSVTQHQAALAIAASQAGLANVPNVKQNLAATTSPDANDDSGDGYVVGSRWVNTLSGNEYVCLDASAGAAIWKATTMEGTGDVDGPLSATDNALARWDGTTGKLLQNSLITLSDTGSITLPAAQTVDGRDVSADGATLDSHVADASKHRLINDAATSTTALWSSDKISTQLAGKSSTGHTHTASDVSDFAAAADARITLQKGASSGLATLDGSGKVPASQLSISSLQYQGGWNAASNTPALANASCTQGHFYIVTTAGSVVLDGIGSWSASDWVVCSATNVWQKVDNTDAVTSVNGYMGAVTLVASDIASGTFADARISQSSVTQHVAALNHDALTNYVADKHITHTSIVITAGIGLGGGGNIAASRTLDLDLTELSLLATVEKAADYLLIYDNSAGAHKRVIVQDLPFDTSPFQLGGDTAGANRVLGNNDAYDLTLETSNAARITIKAAGNVGIGTASPAATLDVAGNIAVSGTVDGRDISADAAHFSSTANPHSVTKAQVGLSNVPDLKQNLAATGAPTASDSSSSGYAVGSWWFDVTNKRTYSCFDATPAAAVWREVNQDLPMVIATWTANTVRYWAVDYDGGSDSNAGYSDVSMSAAGSVALKTLEKLASLFPKNGNGRRAVVCIKARAAGATYRNAANTADDDLDFLQGVYAYESLIVRGTATVSTAGATAFADDSADQIAAGGMIVSGTNAAGYNPTGSPSAISFTCQLNGGGAAALTAETALLGKRIRFSSTTTTTALRNVAGMIWSNDASTITLDANLAATPSTADVFYIEQPGVVVNRVRLSSANSESNADPSTSASPYAFSGIVVVGIRTAGTANPQMVLSGAANVQMSFMEVGVPTANAASNTVIINGFDSFRTTSSYTNDAGSSVLTGVGWRVGGLTSASRVRQLTISSAVLHNSGATATGRYQIFNCGNVAVGRGCVVTEGVLVQDSLKNGVSGGSTAGTAISGSTTIGAGSTAGASRLRITGVFSASISLVAAPAQIYGVDITNAGSSPMIRASSIVAGFSIDDVVGSTGNTGNGLDLTRCVACVVYAGVRASNTYSTSGSAIVMGDSTVYALADYVRTDLRDRVRNHIIGSAGILMGPSVVLAANDANATITQYAVVRATTAAGAVRMAKADTAANAAGIAGVAQSAFGTTASGHVVTAGTTWVQFDATPTAGNVAYLSTANSGNAQDTVPAVSGTNQQLRLGRIQRVSGTLGLVAWEPELLSSAAVNNNRIMVSSGGTAVEAAALTNGQLLIGSTGAAPAAATLTGTTNQITVSNAAGGITLSAPQNLHTAATPTFASETLTATTNQLTLGTTNTVTLSASAPSASRTYTIHDAGAAANLVLDTGGALTITNAATTGQVLTATATSTATWQAAPAAVGGWTTFSTIDSADTSTRCWHPAGSSARVACDTTLAMGIMPVACTAQNLYVALATAPGATKYGRKAYICTATLANCLAGGTNGCNTNCISCSIFGNAVTCNTGANTLSIPQGNAVLFRMELDTSAGSANPSASLVAGGWQCK